MKFYTIVSSALLAAAMTACQVADRNSVKPAAPGNASRGSILENKKFPDRMKAIWEIWNKQNRTDALAALNRLCADPALNAKDRETAFRTLLTFGQRMNDAAAIRYAMNELFKLTPDRDARAMIFLSVAQTLHSLNSTEVKLSANQALAASMSGAKAQYKLSPVQQECLAILDNPKYAMKTRGEAMLALGRCFNASRNNKKQIPEITDAHFLTIKGLPDDIRLNVLAQVAWFCGNNWRNTKADAYRYAKMVLADSEATTSQKISMLKHTVTQDCGDGKFAECLKLTDELLAAKDLHPSQWQWVELIRNAAHIRMWQEDCDNTVKFLRAHLDKNRKAVYPIIAEVYLYFERFDDAMKMWQEAGLPIEAAKVIAPRYPGKARAIALQVLEDPKQTDTVKAAALGYFLDGTDAQARSVRTKYQALIGQNLKDAFSAYRLLISNGAYADAAFLFPFLERSGVYKNDLSFYEMSLQLAAATQDRAMCGLLEKSCAANKDMKAGDRARIVFCAAALDIPDRSGAADSFLSAYPFEKNITAKERANLILKASSLLLNAGREIAAKEMHDAYLAMLQAEPCKIYQVAFSDTPLLGLADFIALKNQPERQKMDRKYGGNTDIFVTDVNTGDRGSTAGLDNTKKTVRPTELQIAADRDGVHFLFTIYDDQAREVEAGTVNGGGFEMYFAAGENQPHICLLPKLDTGRNDYVHYNAYPTKEYRRLDPSSGAQELRSQILYKDDCYLFYMMISWTPHFTALPDRPGDTWDFENIYWSRFGGSAWNGVRSIHGRSDFGKLEFQMTREQLRAVKRRIIMTALRSYQQEKLINGKIHGVIERWKIDDKLGDPVFYRERVAPVVEKLDSYIPLVTGKMSGEDIDKVFAGAVPGWFNIRFTISELRRQYLEDKLLD